MNEIPARGAWLLAWTASIAVVVGTIASKIADVLAADKIFEVSKDVTVYQDAVISMLHGLTLYSTEIFRNGDLAFIYPPFAAIVMAPMGYIDTWALVIVNHLALIVALFVALWVALRAEGISRPSWWALAVVGPALTIYVVSSNLDYGQINIVLMVLVFADLFGLMPARLRGVGIGIAAAIKLTPIGFVLVLLVRRDWASSARAIATLAATVGIGFLALPSDSHRFWTSIAWDADRGGVRHLVDNQSFTGPMVRGGIGLETVDLIYLFIAVPLVAAVAWSAWVFHQRGWDTACVGIVGLGIVYISPMSVQHHWYIVLLAPVMLLSARYTTIAPWLMAAVAMTVANPVEWFRRRDWPVRLDLPWAAIVLEALVSVGVFVLIVAAAVSSSRWYRSERATKQVLGTITA